MKFMKLGSKPDAFQAQGNCVRHISSELPTDIIINVDDVKFYLHKFPLLSKSNTLQRLISEPPNQTSNEIQLPDFPGGPKAFEICAKFCYGITVTLNPYNIVSTRVASEYLEMSEVMERGNLILKIEIFLNSSILRNWKDSIIVLQTTKPLLQWSENLKIVGRCIDSVASKTSVDPLLITWSYTYNRKIANSEIKFPGKIESVPRDWWIEDICELDIDMFKRVMVAIKLKGRMDGVIIGETLKTYAFRWLPDSVEELLSEVSINRNRSMVESLICLLPSDKGVTTCACSFLLKLLKVAILIRADELLLEDLMTSVALRLDEALVSDLLIPARLPQDTIYDVELVQSLVDRFVENSKSESEFALRVGKVVDGYLGAIAHDPNLSLMDFVKLARSVPQASRPIHDWLYGAIDIYMKDHKNLSKPERKQLCGLMEVKKLTTEASMHAAQNEQLPLRVVVQVLYIEQAKASAKATRSTRIDGPENWAKAAPDNRKSLRKQMDEMKMKEDQSQVLKSGKLTKRGSKNGSSGAQLLPSRSRRIFEKLWLVGKGENKSSETSASSQSPTSMAQGEMKMTGLSLRHRRHSIS